MRKFVITETEKKHIRSLYELYEKPSRFTIPFAGYRIYNNQGVDVFEVTNMKDACYYGKEMKWKTFKNKYGDYKLNSLHTYPMRRIWKIIVAKEEPYKSKNLTNYINEIRGKSNCELKLRALYAKKDIKKGDELLLDYPEDYNRFWLNKTKTKTRKNKK